MTLGKGAEWSLTQWVVLPQYNPEAPAGAAMQTGMRRRLGFIPHLASAFTSPLHARAGEATTPYAGGAAKSRSRRYEIS